MKRCRLIKQFIYAICLFSASLILGCDSGGGSSDSKSSQNPSGSWVLTGAIATDRNNPDKVVTSGYSASANIDSNFNISYTLCYEPTGRCAPQAYNIKEVDPDYFYDGDTLTYSLGDSADSFIRFTWQRI